MVIIRLEELNENIEKILPKCDVFVAGKDTRGLPDSISKNIDITPCDIEPDKELVQQANMTSSMTSKSRKKLVKKYVKAAKKGQISGRHGYFSLLETFTAGKKVPILIVNDKTPNFEFNLKCIKAVFAEFGMKPMKYKDIKADLKKKKAKAVKKIIKKVQKMEYDEEAIAVYDAMFRFDKLYLKLHNEVKKAAEDREDIKKSRKIDIVERLKYALEGGSKKDRKKAMKTFKKVYELNLDIPKLKKLEKKAKNVDTAHLVVIACHMLVSQLAKMGTIAYKDLFLQYYKEIIDDNEDIKVLTLELNRITTEEKKTASKK